MKKTAWKVLNKGMESNSGNIKWKLNQWQHHDGELKLCESGLHASKLCVDAIQYVTPGIICKVEYKGGIKEQDDKFVCNDMKVIKTYRFTKRIAVELAIFSARLCLKNFEKEFPDDNRPRLAIESAEKYFKKPSTKTKLAAKSAAWSAESAAELAVRSAESAAESAARSARSAAESAARSARSAWSAWAAWSAESAVRSSAELAVRSVELAVKKKIENKLIKLLGDDIR